MSSMVSRSMVLGNDGLLGDILLRVDSPRTLVHAALVSKRWLRGASFLSFLRRFRELHPPRLLGVYVTGDGLRHTEFVRMPNPQPADLTAITARANLDFGAGLPDFASAVWDVRGGRVLYAFAASYNLPRFLALRAPLQYPGRDARVLPPPPPVLAGCPHSELLVPDSGDQSHGGATCYRVNLGVWDHVVVAKVHVLKPREDRVGEEWSVLCSCSTRLDVAPVRFLATLLTGSKVYTLAAAGFVVVLDMAAETLFVVDLPGGVTFDIDGSNVAICRGDDDAFCLVHVEDDNLSVWVHRDGAGWVLRDTISMKETCANFLPKPQEEEEQQQQADGEEVGPEAEDGDNNATEEEVGPEAEDGDDDARAGEEVGPEAEDGDMAVEVGSEEEDDDDDDGALGDVVLPEAAAEEPMYYYVMGAGDNAEFVFLELDDSGVIVYMHLGSKKVEKVYQRDPDNDNAIRVLPFMMVWPPTFPVLPEGETEAEE